MLPFTPFIALFLNVWMNLMVSIDTGLGAVGLPGPCGFGYCQNILSSHAASESTRSQASIIQYSASSPMANISTVPPLLAASIHGIWLLAEEQNIFLAKESTTTPQPVSPANPQFIIHIPDFTPMPCSQTHRLAPTQIPHPVVRHVDVVPNVSSFEFFTSQKAADLQRAMRNVIAIVLNMVPSRSAASILSIIVACYLIRHYLSKLASTIVDGVKNWWYHSFISVATIYSKRNEQALQRRIEQLLQAENKFKVHLETAAKSLAVAEEENSILRKEKEEIVTMYEKAQKVSQESLEKFTDEHEKLKLESSRNFMMWSVSKGSNSPETSKMSRRLRNSLVACEQQLDLALSSKKVLTNILEATNTKVKSSESKYHDLMQANEDLKILNSQLSTTQKEMKLSMSKFENRDTVLSMKLSKTEAHASDMKAYLIKTKTEYNTERNAHKETIRELMDKVSRIKQELSAQKTVTSDLEHQMRTLNSQLENAAKVEVLLKQEKQVSMMFETMISDLNAKLSGLHKEAEEKQAAYHEHYKSYNVEVLSLRKELESERAASQKLVDLSNEKLTEITANHEKQLQTIKAEVLNFDQERKDIEKALKAELSKAQKELQALRDSKLQESDALKAELGKVRDEMKQIKASREPSSGENEQELHAEFRKVQCEPQNPSVSEESHSQQDTHAQKAELKKVSIDSGDLKTSKESHSAQEVQEVDADLCKVKKDSEEARNSSRSHSEQGTQTLQVEVEKVQKDAEPNKTPSQLHSEGKSEDPKAEPRSVQKDSRVLGPSQPSQSEGDSQNPEAEVAKAQKNSEVPNALPQSQSEVESQVPKNTELCNLEKDSSDPEGSQSSSEQQSSFNVIEAAEVQPLTRQSLYGKNIFEGKTFDFAASIQLPQMPEPASHEPIFSLDAQSNTLIDPQLQLADDKGADPCAEDASRTDESSKVSRYSLEDINFDAQRLMLDQETARTYPWDDFGNESNSNAKDSKPDESNEPRPSGDMEMPTDYEYPDFAPDGPSDEDDNARSDCDVVEGGNDDYDGHDASIQSQPENKLTPEDELPDWDADLMAHIFGDDTEMMDTQVGTSDQASLQESGAIETSDVVGGGPMEEDDFDREMEECVKANHPAFKPFIF